MTPSDQKKQAFLSKFYIFRNNQELFFRNFTYSETTSSYFSEILHTQKQPGIIFLRDQNYYANRGLVNFKPRLTMGNLKSEKSSIVSKSGVPGKGQDVDMSARGTSNTSE